MTYIMLRRNLHESQSHILPPALLEVNLIPYISMKIWVDLVFSRLYRSTNWNYSACSKVSQKLLLLTCTYTVDIYGMITVFVGFEMFLDHRHKQINNELI